MTASFFMNGKHNYQVRSGLISFNIHWNQTKDEGSSLLFAGYFHKKMNWDSCLFHDYEYILLARKMEKQKD